jgi:hypothetical protein
MTTQTRSTTRARLAALGTIGALAGMTTLALLVTATGPAQATSSPDLKITQFISGSTQSGHAFDTFTIKNNGSAAASHVNMQMYTTVSGAFGDIFVSGSIVCEVMPVPAPYNFGTACQVSGSIAAGASVSFKADFSGTPGNKFTNLATVGEYQGDANNADNKSTVSSWFGIRADLALAGTAKSGPKKGHLTAVTTVVNRGPNKAVHLQEAVEVKNVSGATATGSSGSCQVIAPATGYDFAFTCVKDGLFAHKAWKITFDYRGTSGKKATMVTTISSLTKDPNSKNNKITRVAKLK